MGPVCGRHRGRCSGAGVAEAAASEVGTIRVPCCQLPERLRVALSPEHAEGIKSMVQMRAWGSRGHRTCGGVEEAVRVRVDGHQEVSEKHTR